MKLVQCSIKGCKRNKTSRHRFPHPKRQPERYKKWIILSGNPRLLSVKPEKVYINRKVCHIHFQKSDITSNQFISRDSLPSLNLPPPLELSPEELEALDTLIKLNNEEMEISLTPIKSRAKLKSSINEDQEALINESNTTIKDLLKTCQIITATKPTYQTFKSQNLQAITVDDVKMKNDLNKTCIFDSKIPYENRFVNILPEINHNEIGQKITKRYKEEDPLKISLDDINNHHLQLQKNDVIEDTNQHYIIKNIDDYKDTNAFINSKKLKLSLQIKNREKKKMWLNQMKEQMVQLKAQNKNLLCENLKLKNEIAELKSQLSNCNGVSDVMKKEENLPKPILNLIENLKTSKSKVMVVPLKTNSLKETIVTMQIPPWQNQK